MPPGTLQQRPRPQTRRVRTLPMRCSIVLVFRGQPNLELSERVDNQLYV